ncbi:Rop family plasmid primer RNA-binding protein [Hyphomicrobium sp. 1Nfss2.1]|uniref:CCE_0567 family metalloprotein n=1 Tax=unclassified Hyphomicrobium TaxID=2619925 RepID=UPI000930EBD5|nr:CCE_0567 family metalloprotein [Hyphomicrobium sp. NDB2Meth4]
MADIDALKADIKKLSAKATNMKMNLHDLSEELPINWTSILSVAQETYDSYKALEEARAALKQAEASAA